MLFNGSRISPRMMEQTPNILLATNFLAPIYVTHCSQINPSNCSAFWRDPANGLLNGANCLNPLFKVPYYLNYLSNLISCSFPYHSLLNQFSSVQSLSRVWLFATPWTVAHQASLSITNSWSLLKLMSIKLVMPSNHLILCRHLLLLPSIFPSIRVFSNQSVLLNSQAEIPAMTKTSLLCFCPWLITFTRLASLLPAPERHMSKINFLKRFFFLTGQRK